jgi:cytidine deaminase
MHATSGIFGTDFHIVLRLRELDVKPPVAIDPVTFKKSVYDVTDNPFFITSDQVTQILKANPGLTLDQFLQNLVPVVQEYARPLISKYSVGVVGVGASGNVYAGVNLEFADLPSTIHGEQFMAINARNHGEEYIVTMALSAAPCGCCRQFLNEIGKQPGKEASKIRFIIPNNAPVILDTLLPLAFGPQDLGVQGGLLSPTTAPTAKNIALRAKEAALASYTPYSKCPSGVGIQTADGTVFSGSYVENAAFNPAVPPLTSALVDLVSRGFAYNQITQVVLAQQDGAMVDQLLPTRAVLDRINPQVQVTVVSLN